MSVLALYYFFVALIIFKSAAVRVRSEALLKYSASIFSVFILGLVERPNEMM